MIDNAGKIALVFGVRNDSSISWHITKKLVESGCMVAISYMPGIEREIIALLEQNGMDKELATSVDVRNENEIENFINKIHLRYGNIDYILHGTAYGNQKVMCSTLPGSQELPTTYLDIPFDDLIDSFNTSAYSLLRICRVAEKYLSLSASILTLTYNASQRVFPGYAGMGINKAALENIVIYLAQYFGKSGVRVNAISAGLVMTTSSGGIKGVRQLRKISKNTSPLGNIKAGDVADTALYYFSALSQKVTGNIHFLDGGYNIMGVSTDES
ncbi:MAG TPA: SDR family oxidoreductase [Chitinophagaceae bacterium]|nr:SDR family oxidoreductase [Chitinophagaceae bacterium]